MSSATSNTKFANLTSAQQRAVIVGSTLEVTLLVTAQWHLLSTPRSQVRGHKWAWFLGNFVSFFGPTSYFLWGRQRPRGSIWRAGR